MSASTRASAHGNAVVVGEKGVLIRGPSGSGKSALSLALIEAAYRRGLHAALVADDRVRLQVASRRVVARPVAGFEGMIERRGQGIVSISREDAATLALVVDLAPREHPSPRYPDEPKSQIDLLGTPLPYLELDLSWGEAGCVGAILSKLEFDSP